MSFKFNPIIQQNQIPPNYLFSLNQVTTKTIIPITTKVYPFQKYIDVFKPVTDEDFISKSYTDFNFVLVAPKDGEFISNLEKFTSLVSYNLNTNSDLYKKFVQDIMGEEDDDIKFLLSIDQGKTSQLYPIPDAIPKNYEISTVPLFQEFMVNMAVTQPPLQMISYNMISQIYYNNYIYGFFSKYPSHNQPYSGQGSLHKIINPANYDATTNYKILATDIQTFLWAQFVLYNNLPPNKAYLFTPFLMVYEIIQDNIQYPKYFNLPAFIESVRIYNTQQFLASKELLFKKLTERNIQGMYTIDDIQGFTSRQVIKDLINQDIIQDLEKSENPQDRKDFLRIKSLAYEMLACITLGQAIKDKVELQLSTIDNIHSIYSQIIDVKRIEESFDKHTGNFIRKGTFRTTEKISPQVFLRIWFNDIENTMPYLIPFSFNSAVSKNIKPL